MKQIIHPKSDASIRKWDITKVRGNIFEMTFEPQYCLDGATTASIIRSVQHHSPAHPGRLLLHLSALSDVTPDVAVVISQMARPTRLAFLGESMVDEVIARFVAADLDAGIVASYFENRDEALAFLRGDA